MKLWVLLMGLLLTGCGSPDEPSKRKPPSENARDFLEGFHARVVWLQDAGDQKDVFALGDRLVLKGWDSQDPKGEQSLLPTLAAYSKPLLTPDGKHVVYTLRPEPVIHILTWGQQEPRALGKGFALDTWQDPDDGRIWVYAGRQVNDKGAFTRLIRFPIDNPSQVEILFENQTIQTDSFQVSDDGTVAAGLFPWPQAGLMNLTDGSITLIDKGCWTSLSPGNEQLFWVFEDDHQYLTLHQLDSTDTWSINLTGEPPTQADELYHPRWSNHPHFMAFTGPYLHRHGGNNIRGGGPEVEIRLARFSSDYRRIESIVQLTLNTHADFYPDLWIRERP